MERKYQIGIVGVTGAVGSVLCSLLQERKFPIAEVFPFASERSRGKKIKIKHREYPCRVLEPKCFVGMDLVFFDASDALSKEWVPQAANDGAWVIDNSGVFRMDPDVPLIVPEVNGFLIESQIKKSFDQNRVANQFKTRVFSGPNCTVAPLVLALNPIYLKFGIERLVVSTYQSVSGAGNEAMKELALQTEATLKQEQMQPKVFQHPIAFNCIPQIGSFFSNGATSEEQKLIDETRRILNNNSLPITATAVRVPTFSCHAESVNMVCKKPFQVAEIREILQRQPGVSVLDDPDNFIYPMGKDSVGTDSVNVGRIRKDYSIENGVNLWLVSDNLRKGAALNAIQIAEVLLDYIQ